MHESGNLKQAVPFGRDVDLLRRGGTLATPSSGYYMRYSTIFIFSCQQKNENIF